MLYQHVYWLQSCFSGMLVNPGILFYFRSAAIISPSSNTVSIVHYKFSLPPICYMLWKVAHKSEMDRSRAGLHPVKGNSFASLWLGHRNCPVSINHGSGFREWSHSASNTPPLYQYWINIRRKYLFYYYLWNNNTYFFLNKVFW